MRIARPHPGEPIRLLTGPDGKPALGKDGLPRYRAVCDAGQSAGGKRRQLTSTHPTLSAARDWVAKTRADVKSGRLVAPERSTFDEVADAWLASKSGVREVTRLSYVSQLKAIRPHLGAKRVQAITRADVDGMMKALAQDGARLGRPLSRRSLSYSLMVAKAVLAYALRSGLVVSNVAQGVEIPRDAAKRREVTPWTPAELLAFRAVADEHAWAAAWRLSLSGLRRSEVLGLGWDAVDLDAGTIDVKRGRVRLDGSNTATDDTKSTASERTVPVEALHPGTVALMRSLRARQAADRLAAGTAYADTGFVLVDALGAPIAPEAYTAAFRGVCVAAGVSVVPLHWVRHALATILHRSGTEAADAARLLGHSTAVHLAHYVTATQPGVNRAAERFAQALASAQ